METSKLEEKLGYKFRDPELLAEALTHSIDYSNNSQTITVSKHTCDRLKLIGDCVIKLLTCQYAISVSKPDEKLGSITKIKDDICNRSRQHQVGQLLNLQEHVVMTEELKNTPSFSISNHHETFVKSIMGAIFIDAGGSDKKGFKSTWNVFLKLWSHAIGGYPQPKQLVQCFPEPKFSSAKFLIERFTDLKDVKFKDVKDLETSLGFQFLKRPYLLEQAMTHDSIEEFGKDDFAHYQTLEFLGDSVVELIIMEYLYCKYDSADPLGQMLFFNRETGQKLYNSKFQVKVARKLQLEQYVIKPPYVTLATYDDFVESLIGAVYVHCGAVAMKKTAKIVLHLWGLEPLVDAVTPAESDNSSEKVVATPTTDPPPPEIPEEPQILTEIQSKLNYKFRDPRIITSVLELECEATSNNSAPCYFKNLQVLGRRTIELLIVEYVVGIIPPDLKSNLSAKERRSIENLRTLLSSKDILNEIADKLELKKFTKNSGDPPDYQDYVFAIFGAMYIDCGSDHSIVTVLFRKLWNSYIQSKKCKPISSCFVNTSEEQKKFRGPTRKIINENMWVKLYTRLGHKFKNRNLAEQALTDEKSLEYAKHALQACPTGNPFALRMIGSAAIELFIAFRSFHNTASCPENFAPVIERFEQSLFKVLGNNLKDLETYYVKQNKAKYTFPPKDNPKYPYEALLGAVYVDIGGGNKACETLEAVIIKQDPSLVKVSKGKASANLQAAATVPVNPTIPPTVAQPRGGIFSPSHGPVFQPPQPPPVVFHPPLTGMFSPPPGVNFLPPAQMPPVIPPQASPFPVFPHLQEFPGACTLPFGPSFYAQPSQPTRVFAPLPGMVVTPGRSGSPGIIGSRPPNFQQPILCTPPPDSNNLIRSPSVASSKSSKKNNSISNSSSPCISRSSTPKSNQSQLSTSANSKCAANFSFSPASQKISTPTPKPKENGQKKENGQQQEKSAFSKPFPSPLTKSPKKQKQPKPNTDGKVTPPYKLAVAVVQAQADINALKPKPQAKAAETLAMQKPQAKSETSKPKPKAENPNQQPKVSKPNPPPSDNTSDEGGSKKKRGKRGGSKKKNTPPLSSPPKIKTPPKQKSPPAAPLPGPSTSKKVSVPCATKSQTSNGTHHSIERPSTSSSASSTSSVPINKVHGYMNEKYKHKPDSFEKPDKKPEAEDKVEDSTFVSMYTVIKWTTVALGVFFLINKYANRK